MALAPLSLSWAHHIATIYSPGLVGTTVEAGGNCEDDNHFPVFLANFPHHCFLVCLCPQPGCLDTVEVARGCEGLLEGTLTGLEAGKLQAQAQDLCHQLLEDPFSQCHGQVWVEWRW